MFSLCGVVLCYVVLCCVVLLYYHCHRPTGLFRLLLGESSTSDAGNCCNSAEDYSVRRLRARSLSLRSRAQFRDDNRINSTATDVEPPMRYCDCSRFRQLLTIGGSGRAGGRVESVHFATSLLSRSANEPSENTLE